MDQEGKRMAASRNDGQPVHKIRTRPACGRDVPVIAPISAQSRTVQTALRALNNANARETSFLTDKDWHAIVAGSFAATCITGTAALLIALDQDAEYGSTNFIWFQACRPRFVYIDRIVISKRYRGRGFATCLYHDLFERASAAGHNRVVCCE